MVTLKHYMDTYSFNLPSPKEACLNLIMFFMDDSVFVTENIEELERLAPILADHFNRLGMLLHVGSNETLTR